MGKKKNHKKLSKKKKGKKKSSFKKSIDKLNIHFLILGVFSLLVGIYSINDKTAIRTNALTIIDATLKGDIHFLKGRRTEYNCYIYTKEYTADFVVPKGAAPGNINGLLRDLKKGDHIQLSIMNWESSSLKDDSKDITIYAISHNYKPIYTLDDYNTNITNYDYRIGVLLTFVGCLLLLSAFGLITLRQGFIICVAFIVIVIFIKLFI